MRRGLWFLAGVGAAAYAAARARRAAEAVTPDGLRDRLNGLALGARLVRDEVVRAGAVRETELRERLGLPPAHPEGPMLAAGESAVRGPELRAVPRPTDDEEDDA